MIRVESISFKGIQGNFELKEKKSTPIVNHTQLSPDYVMRNLANVSMVSFTGNSYYETLKENYFKLPMIKNSDGVKELAKPDIFQKAAAENLYAGNDVVVTAPTGTGKTAIALYAITKNLEDGKKTFYTTPLKALSNEKFRDFQRIYGKENVGLLTGDVKVNGDAPIVIMTTEVYRNMIFADKFKEHNNTLDNLGTVVFDELHYLGDVDRGGIWEQSIILSKPETQLLSLSATVGNNKDVAAWMANVRNQQMEYVSPENRDLSTYRASKELSKHTVLVNVPPENRHVPLKFNNFKAEPKTDNAQQSRHKNKTKNKKHAQKTDNNSRRTPIISSESYIDAVKKLRQEDRLPAIFFVFNKKGSRIILNDLSTRGPSLTSPAEKEEIKQIIQRFEGEGKYLGEYLNKNALFNGYAMHNSGLLPVQKELIEELFQKKLVKVVIATETLSAGINMPTRTTVITATRKPSSTPDGTDNKRDMTPNEFHQMAGRAGRRGIDTIGYCYTMSLDKEEYNKFQNLINSLPNDLSSSFRPDFSFIAGYYDTCSDDEVIKELFEKSFYAYDPNPDITKENSKNLMNAFNAKKAILQNFKYIDRDNQLTDKGRLLAKLNGYEQIPIIEMTANRKFANMNPTELAAAIGTMANIDDVYEKPDRGNGKHGKQKNVSKETIVVHENYKIEDFVDDLNQQLDKYNMEMTRLGAQHKPKETDFDATQHIYEWAKSNDEDLMLYLNTTHENNWQEIIKGQLKETVTDEGSVFKEITATIDLLKQMKSICEVGIQNTNGTNPIESKDEFKYYYNLSKTIDKSIALLSHPPIVEE